MRYAPVAVGDVLQRADGVAGHDSDADGLPDVRTVRPARCHHEHAEGEYRRARRDVRAAVVRAHLASGHPEHRRHLPRQSPQRNARAVRLCAILTTSGERVTFEKSAAVIILKAKPGQAAAEVLRYEGVELRHEPELHRLVLHKHETVIGSFDEADVESWHYEPA